MRLAKFLSNAGIASRRRSEELIAEGRVAVNGTVVLTPACVVVPGEDTVVCDGRAVTLAKPQYVLLNKPVGYTCSAQDEHAERLIYELLPESMAHLYYVGRLDRDTEGLLLMTNDGDLAQALTHPSREVPKVYVADVAGRFGDREAEMILRGLMDEGEYLHAKAVRIRRDFGDHRLLEVVLTEGKKREVRRLCRAVGLRVLRLARVEMAGIRLGNLPSGQWRDLTEQELQHLRIWQRAPRKPRR